MRTYVITITYTVDETCDDVYKSYAMEAIPVSRWDDGSEVYKSSAYGSVTAEHGLPGEVGFRVILPINGKLVNPTYVTHKEYVL